MNKVLVTGASGFVGRQTLKLLKDKGFEVHAISRERKLCDNYIWHNKNLLNIQDTYELISTIRPTYLLHFAWDVDPCKYLNSVNNYEWVIASLKLIQAFHKFGGNRVIVAGTCAEYDWSYGYLNENNSPLSNRNPYASCKNSLQQLVSSYADSVGMSFAWGRMFWLYGPYENKYRLIPSLITSLMNETEFVCRNGDSIRDYLHVYDVAEAFTSLLLSEVKGIVNIASGTPIKIKDLVKRVASHLDKEDFIKFINNEDENKFVLANTERLKNEVKWIPKVTLDIGITNTIDWWRSIYENDN